MDGCAPYLGFVATVQVCAPAKARGRHPARSSCGSHARTVARGYQPHWTQTCVERPICPVWAEGGTNTTGFVPDQVNTPAACSLSATGTAQTSRYYPRYQHCLALSVCAMRLRFSQLLGPLWTHGSELGTSIRANLPGHVVCHVGKKLGVVLGGSELAKCGVCAFERGNIVHWAERARGDPSDAHVVSVSAAKQRTA